MSKIDELKIMLTTQRRMVEVTQSALDEQRKIEQEIENKIAALEAESAKPRTFTIAIDGNGDPVSVGSFSAGEMVPVKINVKLPVSFITVREVKSVVVNQATANKIYAAWRDLIGPADSPECIVAMLKAAGIDAVAAE